MKKIEKEFEQIRAFIASSRNRAAGFMNYAAVATYWTIGAYVSIRLASKDWGAEGGSFRKGFSTTSECSVASRWRAPWQ